MKTPEQVRKELQHSLRDIPEILKKYISQQTIDGYMDTDLDDLGKMINNDECFCTTEWPRSDDLERDWDSVYCEVCNKQWAINKDEDWFEDYSFIN